MHAAELITCRFRVTCLPHGERTEYLLEIDNDHHSGTWRRYRSGHDLTSSDYNTDGSTISGDKLAHLICLLESVKGQSVALESTVLDGFPMELTIHFADQSTPTSISGNIDSFGSCDEAKLLSQFFELALNASRQ